MMRFYMKSRAAFIRDPEPDIGEVQMQHQRKMLFWKKHFRHVWICSQTLNGSSDEDGAVATVCILFTLRLLFIGSADWIVCPGAVALVSNNLHFVFHSLDKLLDSGFYTGEITELSGGPGSGKSQVDISENHSLWSNQPLTAFHQPLPASSGVFCCRRAHLPSSETKRGVCGHDRGADCQTPAADAGSWNQQQGRAGEAGPSRCTSGVPVSQDEWS